MISLRQDALLLSLRPADSVRLVPEANDRRAWGLVEPSHAAQMTNRAERAMREEVPQLMASACGAVEYAQAAVKRRELLKSFVLGACAAGGNRYARHIGDMIYRISEESDWSSVPGAGGYPDFTNRHIDVTACETGALLALTVALGRAQLDALSPLIAARAEWEIGRRLIEPMIVREGEWLSCDDSQAPRAVAALMTATLLVENDERRRWQCIRRLLRLLESHLNGQGEDAAFALGLTHYLERAMAINDCLAMLGEASGGEVELRDEPWFVSLSYAFVDAYIGGGWFVNPGGRSMRPALAPDQLFRLGENARFTPLCALASYLKRHERARDMAFDEASAPLLMQVMDALTRAELLREPAREPFGEAVRALSLPLLAARMEGFYCAMVGAGSVSIDAGDIMLFYRGKPVLASAGVGALQSTPIVESFAQAREGAAAQDVTLRDGQGYRMLSMDIAGAYPRAAHLICWQRTLMMAPFEGGVRLMEVFDFDDAPGRASFRFVTPHRPVVGEGVARLGEVAMSFDARLTHSVEALEINGEARESLGAAYLLTLSMPEPAPSGNYAFVFRPSAG